MQCKYNNKKLETPDGIFDSKKEYLRFCELKIMETDGVIQNLERQKKYELIPKQNDLRKIEYIADFVYIKDGQIIIEDVKPTDKSGNVSKYYKTTEAWKMYIVKKKLMKYIHGLDIVEV